MGMTPRLEQHLDDQDINHQVVVDLGAGAFSPLLMRMHPQRPHWRGRAHIDNYPGEILPH